MIFREPKDYLERSEECQVIASNMKDPVCRQQWINQSLHYKILSRQAEKERATAHLEHISAKWVSTYP